MVGGVLGCGDGGGEGENWVCLNASIDIMGWGRADVGLIHGVFRMDLWERECGVKGCFHQEGHGREGISFFLFCLHCGHETGLDGGGWDHKGEPGKSI